MIDLHLHFDGSLPVKTVLWLAKEQGIELPAFTEEELRPFLEAPKDCRDLNDYLARFDLPLKVLQTRQALTRAMEDLLSKLAGEGMLYAEIRFAPQFHTACKLSQRQVIEAVLEGVNQGLLKNPTLWDIRLILCCMRGTDNRKENLETIELAGEFAGKTKVAAVDLAGAEGVFFTGDFEELFSLAAKKQIPYTIHAGEADGPESVQAAIRMGTMRIGHGVRCVEDPAVEETVRQKKITLECCVTSNIQTRAFASAEAHPLLRLLRSGIKVTVNTDNMTVSNTTVTKEFELLKSCGMTREEQTKLLENSIQAAFLTSKEKADLMKIMLERRQTLWK
ncbi:MAG: adenosine deaminase [Lachnospiraceae bacterium]